MYVTAILTMIECCETAFNDFKCQFTTGNCSKTLKLRPSIIMRMVVQWNSFAINDTAKHIVTVQQSKIYVTVGLTIIYYT